jgi:hypothetical protein
MQVMHFIFLVMKMRSNPRRYHANTVELMAVGSALINCVAKPPTSAQRPTAPMIHAIMSMAGLHLQSSFVVVFVFLGIITPIIFLFLQNLK